MSEHPSSAAEQADLRDKYERMLRLADVFDRAGDQMRSMSRLGGAVLREPALTESAPLSPATYRQAEEEVRAATTGSHGLLTRSIEVDADALVVRATVLTYRWIDELQDAAYQTLGAIAGRAIGYLAPNVALGGAIVSAGLIETDALDRDDVATYLSELAQNNPELMDHVATGGGGLLDGLQMRSLLTAGVLAGDPGRLAARGGLRALGADPFDVGGAAALRDVAGGLLEPAGAVARPDADPAGQVPGPPDAAGAPAATGPRGVADLMTRLAAVTTSVEVERVAPGRLIAYLAGPGGGGGRRLRLVAGDTTTYAAQVVRAVETVVATHPDDPPAHVMLVGAAGGGVAAVELAARPAAGFVVDQVVTAGSPAAHVPRIPAATRVLSLEDRSDPVALLGSLVDAGAANRVTVVFDGDAPSDPPADSADATDGPVDLYVTGGRATDASHHPEVRAELARLRLLGYLTG